MTIDWIRKELEKYPEKVDWLAIAGASTKLYKEYKTPENFLGLKKGFVNLVSCNYYWHNGWKCFDEEAFIKSLCPDAIIIKAQLQSDVVNYVKDLTIDGFKKAFTENMFIILSSKKTVDTYLNRINIPFIKFRSLIECESIKIKPGSVIPEGKPYMKWRKEGSKEIKVKESDIIIHKRDSILEKLLKEDE